MASAPRRFKLFSLLIIVGFLLSTTGYAGKVSARPTESISFSFTAPVSGGGSAGPGSLAVAAVFSAKTSSGLGSFSGTVGGVGGSGLFSLSVGNPVGTPTLPCPLGEVSAGGTIVSGNDWVIPYIGDNVIVAGCTGPGVPASFYVYQKITFTWIFAGTGAGSVEIPRIGQEVVVEAAAAGVTFGSGTLGSGTAYTAEADALLSDGTILGGGAQSGSDLVGWSWGATNASLLAGCQASFSGTTALFSPFPSQPITSTYTLTTCPPTTIGPQNAKLVLVLGDPLNPIYRGTGPAITMIKIEHEGF